MGRPDYKFCRICGRHAREVGELSHTRLCEECSATQLASNVVQMIGRTGPNWRRWRRGMAGCVGGVLLDETRERG
jgi:hypothetical protein